MVTPVGYEEEEEEGRKKIKKWKRWRRRREKRVIYRCVFFSSFIHIHFSGFWNERFHISATYMQTPAWAICVNILCAYEPTHITGFSQSAVVLRSVYMKSFLYSSLFFLFFRYGSVDCACILESFHIFQNIKWIWSIRARRKEDEKEERLLRFLFCIFHCCCIICVALTCYLMVLKTNNQNAAVKSVHFIFALLRTSLTSACFFFSLGVWVTRKSCNLYLLYHTWYYYEKKNQICFVL